LTPDNLDISIHKQTRIKVCVIGLGYIGLPTAALLANKGYNVHGVDVDQSVVDTINRGEIHIVEPELDVFVQSAVNSGRLRSSLTPCEADIFILAVPTPFYDGYVPNIDYIISATESIIPFIKENDIVILESTSPVGTTNKVEEILRDKRKDLFNVEGLASSISKSSIFVAHCPERVLPGHIMKELVENDRLVGGTTPEATEKTVEFYKTFVSGEVFATNARTAEMAKLTENSFRDTNIAFANEISILCDNFDIDVWELIKLTNRHPRVDILQPGAGVGGHCIAVDPWFIIHAGKDDARIIKTAREVNLYKTEWVIEKIKKEVLNFENQNNRQPRVACMGLAFKPNIDDLRESSAVYVALKLTQILEDVVACEPNIQINYQVSNKNHQLKLVDLESAISDSDIYVFLVAHEEFKGLNVVTNLDFCGVLHK
jgi:UDP-N-acetyl-D-mannosaminuronic acid dehydrogenase